MNQTLVVKKLDSKDIGLDVVFHSQDEFILDHSKSIDVKTRLEVNDSTQFLFSID